MNVILKNEYNMKINKIKIRIAVRSQNVINKPVIKPDENTLEVANEYK